MCKLAEQMRKLTTSTAEGTMDHLPELWRGHRAPELAGLIAELDALTTFEPIKERTKALEGERFLEVASDKRRRPHHHSVCGVHSHRGNGLLMVTLPGTANASSGVVFSSFASSSVFRTSSNRPSSFLQIATLSAARASNTTWRGKSLERPYFAALSRSGFASFLSCSRSSSLWTTTESLVTSILVPARNNFASSRPSGGVWAANASGCF